MTGFMGGTGGAGPGSPSGGAGGPSGLGSGGSLRAQPEASPASLHYAVRLAAAAFADGLLDAPRLVEWGAGQLAALAAALARGAHGGGADGGGGAAGLPASEQLRGSASLQLLVAALPYVGLSQVGEANGCCG
jgi:hypothetical protein